MFLFGKNTRLAKGSVKIFSAQQTPGNYDKCRKGNTENHSQYSS